MPTPRGASSRWSPELIFQLVDQDDVELLVASYDAMAEPLVIPNAAMVRIIWDLRGQPAFNVLGAIVSPGLTFDQTLANSVATTVRTAFVSAGGQTHQSQATHMTNVGIRDLRTPNQAEWIGTMTASAGSDTGEPIPLSTALVVTLRTALAGKSYRGRIFLPLDGAGAWDGAAQAYTTAAATVGTSFIGNIKTQWQTDPVIQGRLTLAVLSRVKLSANAVTSQQVRSQISGTQRNRMPKRA